MFESRWKGALTERERSIIWWGEGMTCQTGDGKKQDQGERLEKDNRAVLFSKRNGEGKTTWQKVRIAVRMDEKGGGGGAAARSVWIVSIF